MQLSSLSEVLAELERLGASSSPTSATAWSIPKTLVHCAQSIDASREGFPRMKPAFIRKTVGRLVLGRFLKKGAMSHDKEGPIPGLPEPAEASVGEAIATLRASIAAFQAHEGALMPHFVFDELGKDEYERIHAMHIADHLSSMEY